MNWPFIAVLFSGWLYIDAAYRGPNWQRWVFRPVTLLLLLLWAWSGDYGLDISGYLVCVGLLVAIVSDTIRLVADNKIDLSLYTSAVFYLLYALSFALLNNFTFYIPLMIAVPVIAIAVLALLWYKLGDHKVPVLTALLSALVMGWLAGEQFFGLGTDYNFSLMIGAFCLVLNLVLWLINRFLFTFKLAKAIYSTFYFLGHFLIVRAITLM
ncbi:lysoplasmalogenase [Morganella morganii]|uniref:lysoplasmalogenase n=1 Tax=Morganella morganii TaxID=582 RepID=UPI0030FEDE48